MIHSKQREFKVTRTETEHVSATSYHEGRVEVKYASGIVQPFKHEDNIPPEWKTSAPELYEFVRKELCSNRPLKPDETRSLDASRMCIGKMSVEGHRLAISFPDRTVRHTLASLRVAYASSRSPEEREERARRLKFLESRLAEAWQLVDAEPGWEVRKNRYGQVYFRDSVAANTLDGWEFTPQDANAATVTRRRPETRYCAGTADLVVPEAVLVACCKLLGCERLAPLAENEIRSSRGDVVQLRWHNGERQRRWMSGGGSHEGWGAFHSTVFGDDNQLKAEAWFRANCPADRFVTDEGEVLVFRLDENTGEAYCEGWGVTSQTFRSASEVPENYSDLGKAIYRFRDAEQAKWTFTLDVHGVSVLYDGQYGFGGYYSGEGASRRLEAQPAWVRARAKSVFEEANAPAPAARIQFDAVAGGCGATRDRITGTYTTEFTLIGEHSEHVELRYVPGCPAAVLDAALDRRKFRVTVEVVPEGEGS